RQDVDVFGQPGEQPCVPAVTLRRVPVGPADASAQILHAQSAQVLQDRLDAIVLARSEPLGETDSRAARFRFGGPLHTISPRAASSARASMPRSIAVCPVSQEAKSSRPCSSVTRGAQPRTRLASEMSA